MQQSKTDAKPVNKGKGQVYNDINLRESIKLLQHSVPKTPCFADTPNHDTMDSYNDIKITKNCINMSKLLGKLDICETEDSKLSPKEKN